MLDTFSNLGLDEGSANEPAPIEPLVSGPQDNTEPTDLTLGHPGINPTVSIRAHANNQAAFANNARIAPEILQPSEDFGDFDPYTDPECALARKLDSEYFEREMHSDQFEAAEESLVKAAFGHARTTRTNLSLFICLRY